MGRTITITRQFGSLGRLIGKRVAEDLGYEYYDRDIIELAAERIGEPIYQLSEYDGQSSTEYGRMGFPLGFGTKKKQDRLFSLERDIILKLAERDDCVIVGRGADFILTEAEVENVYRVFIYAPYSDRLGFCLGTLGLTAEAAEVYMEKVDRAREAFYQERTREAFDSMRYRDLFVNSAAMSLERNAELIGRAAIASFESR